VKQAALHKPNLNWILLNWGCVIFASQIINLISFVVNPNSRSHIGKPFQCEAIDRAILRYAWEKWLRGFTIYFEAEGIEAEKQKRSRLLLLGGVQLQSVVYSLPGALVEPTDENKNNIYKIVIDHLKKHFSPKHNSTFQRHILRPNNLKTGNLFGLLAATTLVYAKMYVRIFKSGDWGNMP